MAPILAHGEEMSFQSKQMMNILFFFNIGLTHFKVVVSGCG